MKALAVVMLAMCVLYAVTAPFDIGTACRMYDLERYYLGIWEATAITALCGRVLE